jgi:hypothetical protein
VAAAAGLVAGTVAATEATVASVRLPGTEKAVAEPIESRAANASRSVFQRMTQANRARAPVTPDQKDP